MSPEPGWYYAQGDPAGTVRRWNGSAWIGFPIERPTEDGGSSRPVERFTPVRGQSNLKILAIFVQIGLLLIGLASAVMAVALILLPADALLDTNPGLSDSGDGALIAFALSWLATALLTIPTGVLFIVWFFLAYRNISLWHRTRRANWWAIGAWFVPFIALVRPMTMMLEIVENSPRSDRQGELSPTPVVAWWILWMFGQFGLLFFLAGDTSDPDGLIRGLIVGLAILAAARAVAAGLAVALVQRITDHQEARRRPTAAQRELMAQEAQAEAFRQQSGHNF